MTNRIFSSVKQALNPPTSQKQKSTANPILGTYNFQRKPPTFEPTLSGDPPLSVTVLGVSAGNNSSHPAAEEAKNEFPPRAGLAKSSGQRSAPPRVARSYWQRILVPFLPSLASGNWLKPKSPKLLSLQDV